MRLYLIKRRVELMLGELLKELELGLDSRNSEVFSGYFS
jgi:hypothetical protein